MPGKWGKIHIEQIDSEQVRFLKWLLEEIEKEESHIGPSYVSNITHILSDDIKDTVRRIYSNSAYDLQQKKMINNWIDKNKQLLIEEYERFNK